MIEIARHRILGYRCQVQQLTGPIENLDRPAGSAAECRVLDAGIRDNPIGGSAAVALRARTGADPAPEGLVRAYTVRGAARLHRAGELGLFAAALRWRDAREPAREALGDLTVPDPVAAVEQITAALRTVTADGLPRTKGELSRAVSDALDPALSPWCERCGAHHPPDGLFRHATLRAGLVIVVEPGGFRLRPADPVPEPIDPDTARRDLLRRFLRLAGAATPEGYGSWLGLSTTGVRRWWQLLADELVPVAVDGARLWAHPDDLAELRDRGAAGGVRLLPPYDPFTELTDRKFLITDAARRGRVWRAVGNPGVIIGDGEVIGIWRDRRARRRRQVRVELFDRVGGGVRGMITDEARLLVGDDAVIDFG